MPDPFRQNHRVRPARGGEGEASVKMTARESALVIAARKEWGEYLLQTTRQVAEKIRCTREELQVAIEKANKKSLRRLMKGKHP